jgi:4'-phosphopantetheinyl transferase
VPAGTTESAWTEHTTSLDEATDTDGTAGTTALWYWRITADRPDPGDWALLAETERARAARMRGERAAAEYVSCRAAVRRLLAGILGGEPADVPLGRRPCPGCGSPEHGPPAVLRPDGPRLSISHSGGLGMLAVSPTAVGVDVEALRDVHVAELADAALTPAERQTVLAAPEPGRTRSFLRCWTRKEAVLKAVGIGITASLTTLETAPERPGPVEVTTDLTDQGRVTWRVTDVPVPHGWVASLAVPATAAEGVTVRAAR